jgi:hypothetical protein
VEIGQVRPVHGEDVVEVGEVTWVELEKAKHRVSIRRLMYMRRGVQKEKETYAPREMVVIVYTIGLKSIHGSIIRGLAAMVRSYKRKESVCHFPFTS